MVQLNGARVAILTTDGVEASEILKPLEALRNAGARVDVLSPEGKDIQLMEHDEKSQTLPSDGRIADADPDAYQAVVLPGGTFNADKLRMSEDARDFVRAIDGAGKTVAAICHAPWLLASAGLVKGRRLTSYYTLQDDLRNAGAEWSDEELVEDGNWITSRSPKDLEVFTDALLSRVAVARQAA